MVALNLSVASNNNRMAEAQIMLRIYAHKKVLLWLLAIIALISLVVSFWLDVNRGRSAVRDLAITAAAYVILIILIRLKVIKLPVGVHVPLISSGPRFPDLLKAAIAMAAAFIWTFFTANLASDTWWGVGLVFAPSVALILAGGFWVFRGLGPKERG